MKRAEIKDKESQKMERDFRWSAILFPGRRLEIFTLLCIAPRQIQPVSLKLLEWALPKRETDICPALRTNIKEELQILEEAGLVKKQNSGGYCATKEGLSFLRGLN